MKRLATILFLMMLFVIVNGATTRWSTNQLISADVDVLTGDTLIIDPGVIVEFTGAYRIVVHGTLIAVGTAVDSIIFRHQTSGNRHYGIDFDQATTVSILRYCRIQDGGSTPGGVYGEPWDSFGGGICTYLSSPRIERCEIVNNSCTQNGGGIFFRYSNASTVRNCVIRGNVASNFGGGIGMTGSLGNEPAPTIINNLIYNNVAVRGGGIGMYRNSNPTLANNVIYGNTTFLSPQGGGLYLENNDNVVNVTNCIMWGNTLSTIADAGTGNTISVTNSDIEGGYIGTRIIDSDPLFLDVANFDFHLTSSSPCVDAGTSTGGSLFDYDSNATNQDGNNSSTNEYDMGAYEYLEQTLTYSADGSQAFTANTFEGAGSNVADINISGLTSSGTIAVTTYTFSMPTNSPTGSKAVRRWYNISEAGGLAYGSATLTLYYSQDEFDKSGLLSETNLTLWHFEGGIWVNKGGTLTNTASGGSIQLSGLSSVDGMWAFADVNDSSLPVMLTSLNSRLTNKGINLYWQTVSETNNVGFEVLRKSNNENDYRLVASYNQNSELKGMGNSSTGKFYSFIDRNFSVNTTYYYKIVSVALDGVREDFGPTEITVTEEQVHSLQGFEISSNYPNPFNPGTQISVVLPEQADITLKVYNTLGQLISSDLYKAVSPGGFNIKWDGTNLPAGVYYYEVYVTNQRYQNVRMKNGKMILLK